MCVAKVAKCGSDTHLDPHYSLACCLLVVVLYSLVLFFGSSGDDDKQKKIILYTHSVLIQYSKCEEARMNPSFEKIHFHSSLQLV